jgi:phospholipid/cholesterol/gamma-HCH transport system substrate-binding protein
LRPALNRALAVGLLAAATGVAFLLALTFFRKGGYSEKQSYLVHAYFSDATGISWKTRAQIAGIQVGEVAGIELVANKAKLDIRVKNGIELHADACLTKTFPSALLPDALLEVQPGSASTPLLSSLPEDQRNINCVREAASMQQLMDSMAKIAADVQTVTSDLAKTVSEQNGLRQIVENLASASKRLDQAIADNERNVHDLIANAKDFSADLREISHRDKDKIGRIFSNVEELSARLKVLSLSLQEIIDPGSSTRGGGRGGGARGGASSDDTQAQAGGADGSDGRSGSASASASARGDADVPAGVRTAVAQASPQERAVAAQQARGVKQAVDKLTDSLERLDDLLAKVQEGKSVAGKILVDERLGRKLGDTLEGFADQYDKIFKLQIQVQLRSEWLLNQSGAKAYLGFRLLPRPDKYYLLELVSDPRGTDRVWTETITERAPGSTTDSTTVATHTIHDPDKLTFSAQFAKRYGPVTFRVGIIESSGGVGGDLHLFRDKLQLSVNAYQFQRPYQSVFPRAKVWVNYYFLQNFFVTAGADDFLNSWREGHYPGGPKFTFGNDAFVGGGIFFTDDDLKTLLGAGAGSAVSGAGSSR